MSDEKRKISFEEMAFHYDFAMRKAAESLFNSESQHGWTEEEFTKILYEEAMKNALQGTDRVLH